MDPYNGDPPPAEYQVPNGRPKIEIRRHEGRWQVIDSGPDRDPVALSEHRWLAAAVLRWLAMSVE